MAAAGGMQGPRLATTSVNCSVPSSSMTAAIFVNRDGSIQTRFDGAGIVCGPTSYPPQWGGFVPTTTMGDVYQVRATHISGNNPLSDPEFDLEGEWHTINTQIQFRSFLSAPGANSAVTLLEIRRLSNQQILASSQWTLTWTDNGL